MDEIRQQIKDFINPESAEEGDLRVLLNNVIPRIQELNQVNQRETKSDKKKSNVPEKKKAKISEEVEKENQTEQEKDVPETDNKNQPEKDSEEKITDSIGKLGIWEGKLGEKELGMIVDDGVLQMFQKKRQGFVPVDLMQKVEDWQLMEEITNYSYELKNTCVYLVF